MPSFAQLGNDLYSGKRGIDVMRTRRTWYVVAALLVGLSVVLLLTKGLNGGIEFRGGSEFRVSDVTTTSQEPAEQAVTSVVPDGEPPRISSVGENAVRVQTERLSQEQTDQVATALAQGYGVQPASVTSSFVGPSWGADVTANAVRGLLIFVVLAAVVLGLYFRTWKMSAAALVALVHDVVITAGVYSLSGFEVTPATVIGFLTILGYSLYDTVVVFDKVRENTEHVLSSSNRTFAEAANLAVNQTLVRSINTSVVALLPVASILFIGAFLLGAGTLRDISLALFVGIIAGTYSSVFLAPPLYVQMREREPDIARQRERVLSRRTGSSVPVAAGAGAGAASATAPGGEATEGAATTTAVLERPARRGTRSPSGGQRQQPRRPGGRRR
ncbi:protein translocase subunit SecF [Quadrisphaera sp. INWT6]|uniref:protein translocase subunit SecF n=1 Tax=Quadrisphaera sp. INWT6 TaxID=2596917 RepID=UPI00189277F3|nr:protein translocase subunit SecF [Quadrisphaera sp. INWT6]MBF5083706.1 protein translocase subunit SecF [Quadrisphaera sp. INWT6]